MIKRYTKMLKREFTNYNGTKLFKDIVAGLTVAAVSLPISIAFSVLSGADAAAGIITAIVAGIVCGLLGGASYQISGPTATMAVILLSAEAKYQMQGIFVVCLMAGIWRVLAGVFRLGKLVNFIPKPVVVGFSSGIAIIIALSQIDNIFGTTSQGFTPIEKIASYGSLGFSPSWQTILLAAIVVAIMVAFPKKWNAKVPSSLVAISVAAVLAAVLKLNVPIIGEIPRSIIHPIRFDFTAVNKGMILDLLGPSVMVALLGMIETLLCGVSAANMKREDFLPNQELLAQGIGNIVIPLFGGLPSTAVLARSSVAIKSGGVTRLTSVFQSVWLILCMLLLSPIIGKLPLSALAGVLLVVSWRMNDWEAIKRFFKNRSWGAVAKFGVTMAATVVFDLVIAIIIGIVFSLLLMAIRMSKAKVEISRVVDCEELGSMAIIHITGALFFANSQAVVDKLKEINSKYDKLIIVMKDIVYLDVSAAQTVLESLKSSKSDKKRVVFTDTRDPIMKVLKRSGVYDFVGEDGFYNNLEDVPSPQTAIDYNNPTSQNA